MDFLFNLISLLANLFSIEDHFKKDNDAKTVINNNYNFYVNNSSSNIDPISRNINMSDRSSLLLLFFVLVFTLIVQLLLTKTLNFIYPNLTWLRRFEKGTILLNIILALLVITILVIRIIHFKKRNFSLRKVFAYNIPFLSTLFFFVSSFAYESSIPSSQISLTVSFLPLFLISPIIIIFFFSYCIYNHAVCTYSNLPNQLKKIYKVYFMFCLSPILVLLFVALPSVFQFLLPF